MSYHYQNNEYNKSNNTNSESSSVFSSADTSFGMSSRHESNYNSNYHGRNINMSEIMKGSDGKIAYNQSHNSDEIQEKKSRFSQLGKERLGIGSGSNGGGSGGLNRNVLSNVAISVKMGINDSGDNTDDDNTDSNDARKRDNKIKQKQHQHRVNLVDEDEYDESDNKDRFDSKNGKELLIGFDTNRRVHRAREKLRQEEEEEDDDDSENEDEDEGSQSDDEDNDTENSNEKGQTYEKLQTQEEKTKTQSRTDSKKKKQSKKNLNHGIGSNLNPSIEPYFARLEKFELFSTRQAYYLVGCDKYKSSYRVLRMDRKLIENPPPKRPYSNYDSYYNHNINRSPSSSYTNDSYFSSDMNAHNMNRKNNMEMPNENTFQSHKQQQQQQQHTNRSGSFDHDGYNSRNNAPPSPTTASIGYNNDVHYNNYNVSPNRHSDPSRSTYPYSHSTHPAHNNNNKYSHSNPHYSPSKHHYQQQQQQQQHQQQQQQHHQQQQHYYSQQHPKHHHYPHSSSHSYSGVGPQTNNTPQKSSSFRRLPDFCIEDPYVYTEDEIQKVLDMIHNGNKVGGGLRPVVKAYGIVGFVTFLDCYYLTLITKRTKVGQIGFNGIYSIKATETFPLKPAERTMNNEDTNPNPGDGPNMLLNMWNRGKRAAGLGLTQREIAELRYEGLYQVVDLTKNFFFSYTYDMTRSLQDNFVSMSAQTFPPPPFKHMYAWNFFLTRELGECTSPDTSTYWILPIIHGAFVSQKISDYGRSLNLTLLARRSRHFAGTRYLKRGVSDRGKVANDVEHEQILHDETGNGTFSSFLQMRGSIPTFWTQESSVTMPKPPIVLNRVDPTYSATQLHFEDLLKRYSSPIVVLDLVKQSEKREREVIVGNEYRHAIDYLNTYIDTKHKIRYCALDYSHISKHRHLNVSSSLNDVATWSVNQTGFFCSKPRWKLCKNEKIEPYEKPKDTDLMSAYLGIPIFPMEQKGVLRTNCIDCLDRTNVAQFSAGVASLAQQLVVMGIRNSVKLDPTSSIVRVLIDMYVEIGDHIALQYGGSEAHKKVESAQVAAKEGPSAGKHKEFLTSVRRYYSNTFTDRLKQDAMNLFLGYYVPSRHTVPLWDMESDYYLHNFHVRAGNDSLKTMKSYEKTFAVDWSGHDDNEETKKDEFGSTISSSVKINAPLSLQHRVLSGDLTLDTFNKSDIEEGIVRIQQRCKAQNKELSVWWKIAIHENIKERIWMKLGNQSTDASIPSRFDRLYQSDKLLQFDKFFSRNFAVPLRQSHSAQHAPSPEDAKEIVRSSSVLPKPVEDDENDGDESTCSEESYHTIDDFVQAHGLLSSKNHSLSHFIQHYEKEPETINTSDEKKEKSQDTEEIHFLGSLTEHTKPCDEYLNYANYSKNYDYSFRKFRTGAREEFAKCLHETNLESNDVEGIRKLAETAHISSKILSGPYEGLHQMEAASKVTTVLHEYYNTSLGDDGGIPQDPSLLLKRNHMDTIGVTKEITEGWNHFMESNHIYGEVLDGSNIKCQRSDLTSERSIRLYASFYEGDTQLTRLKRMYILGDNEESKKKESEKESKGTKHRSIKKSSTKRNRTDEKPLKPKKQSVFQTSSSSQSLKDGGVDEISLSVKSFQPFTTDDTYRDKEGFEQINEDLYARKDNKFMVFNGAGVDVWDGIKPVTKLDGIVDLFTE